MLELGLRGAPRVASRADDECPESCARARWRPADLRCRKLASCRDYLQLTGVVAARVARDANLFIRRLLRLKGADSHDNLFVRGRSICNKLEAICYAGD